MPVPAIHFEAKKHAYRQTQDGVVVSFVVHPNDLNAGFAVAPLGTRYMVALAMIGDDGEPISPGAFIPKSEALASADGEGAPPQKQPTPAPGETKGGWYALKPSARAAILCKDGDFLMWANSTWRLQMLLSELPDWLRNRVDVHSRAQLDPDHAQHRPDALKRYLRIEGQYRVDSGQETAPR